MTKFKGLDCILLIDDDTPTNFIHSRIIKKAGVDTHIQTLTSAIDALDYLTGKGNYEGNVLPQPGIIFLDINMPAMDGWEFLDRYKNIVQDQNTKVIVIMLTTSLNPKEYEHAINNYKEVATFLNKPLVAGQVMELVNRYYKPEGA